MTMASTWNKPLADLQLSEGTIDVWHTSLNRSDTDIENFRAMLSANEHKRADRFTFPGKRNEYIISRGLLRQVLGQLLGADPAGLTFSYSAKFKPYLPDTWNGHTVSFNVSHSHDKAIIAITLDRELGIDIEKIRTNVEFIKLATRFFSLTEVAALKEYSNADLPKAFFACWTRKEAFVKALGKGIWFGLSQFSVAVDPEEACPSLITHWDPEDAAKWSMVNIDTEADYQAALAVAGSGFEVRCCD